VCGLWWEVDELQQRHDFKQLELLVTALTKLQPHYKGPWKYQGWNLAYNVSVEFERAEDKYFYISKGIRWLAYGEEINRVRRYDDKTKQVRIVGDPDLRFDFAQHLSNKMYYADENLLYRPLLHLSCIPPSQRVPSELKNNPAQMARFKAQYPRFVRRVMTYLNIPEGDENTLNRELVQFLTQYKDVPSLWKLDENNRAVLAEDPWPRWPNMADTAYISKVADQELMQDSLDISRQCYSFATEPLPVPNRDLTDEDITPKEDKFTRTNKGMHSMIFRAKPAQTQSRSAFELYKEGWSEQAQAIAAEAYGMWLELGRYTNVLPTDEELIRHAEKSNYYLQYYRDQADRLEKPPEYLKESNPAEYAKALDAYKSHLYISNYAKLRSMCRFDYWLGSMELAKTDEYKNASRYRYIAEHRYTDWPVSLENYQKAFGLFEILLKQPLAVPETLSLRLAALMPGTILAQIHPGTSQTPTNYANIDTVQEDLIEFQQRYLRTYARYFSPSRLLLELNTWEAKQMLAQSMSLMNPTTASLSYLSPVVGRSILNIDWIEDALEGMPAPFDDFIPEAIRESRERDKSIMKK
ncbi:MAG TPA: hypothetical protein PKA06_07375, partial [Gemmatales bacterium]|nr:hypothetical protein [Gemmatales bacterium]